MHRGIVDTLVNGDLGTAFNTVNNFSNLIFDIDNAVPSGSKGLHRLKVLNIFKIVGH